MIYLFWVDFVLLFTYSPLLLYSLGFKLHIRNLSHLFLGPITTLKSPFDHFVHVFMMLMLETCQAYGCICFHEVP
ncbi:hypothetical protein Lalb_Chr25g0281451 [Lupinus albus]|uniref:Uncharacterized protein n=1 Tax=Lupinus albus TaxID=3870 RepID=A0A6A4NDL5_LUPAL|nr:hypothetical protein Lalb_Chr25g0281451 [Lupinus albus]